MVWLLLRRRTKSRKRAELVTSSQESLQRYREEEPKTPSTTMRELREKEVIADAGRPLPVEGDEIRGSGRITTIGYQEFPQGESEAYTGPRELLVPNSPHEITSKELPHEIMGRQLRFELD